MVARVASVVVASVAAAVAAGPVETGVPVVVGIVMVAVVVVTAIAVAVLVVDTAPGNLMTKKDARACAGIFLVKCSGVFFLHHPPLFHFDDLPQDCDRRGVSRVHAKVG